MLACDLQHEEHGQHHHRHVVVPSSPAVHPTVVPKLQDSLLPFWGARSTQ